MNTFTMHNQHQPVVMPLTGGGFVITWPSYGQDGSDTGIYAQRYGADGAVLGGETRVNTYTEGEQYILAGASLADGGYVIAWSSHGQDNSLWGVYTQRYDEEGVAVGSENRVNSFTDNAQFGPAVTSLADGGYLVTWTSSYQDGERGGIYAQRYDVGGAAVGSEFRVNSTTLGNQDHAFAAGLPDNGYVVVWVSDHEDGSDYGIFAQRFDAAGAAVGDEQRVETFTDGIQFYPAVTALANGDYVVTWQSDGQDGSGWGLYQKRFAANVAPVLTGTPAELDRGYVNAPYTVSAADLLDGYSDPDGDTLSVVGLSADHGTVGDHGDGTFTVTPALDYHGVVVLSFTVTDGAGGTSVASRGVVLDRVVYTAGAETQVNTTTEGSQAEPDIAALSDGGYIITWTSYNADETAFDVYAQRYDADGITVSGETRINGYTTWEQYNSAITALADGGYVVAWTSAVQDGSYDGIYAQRYDTDGVAVGGETRINSYTANYQSVPAATALADGGYVITWSSYNQDGSYYGIYTQRYDADGVAVGGETPINSYTPDYQYLSAVTALADGGYVVTWASYGQDGSGYGIYAKRFNQDGVGVGDEELINSHTNDNQNAPSIASLTGGGYVITWSSYEQDGSGFGVYAQSFDVDGVRFGDEVRVNTTTLSHQYQPVVAGLPDGGYAIAWMAIDSDNAYHDVFLQRYDAIGNAIGLQELVNSYKIDDQRNPAIAALANGDFVVTWQSNRDGSGAGVYHKRFSANAVPVQSGTAADLADGHEDVPLTITQTDLLAGIGDPEGGELSVTAISASHGTLSAAAEGWAFTPELNYRGPVVLTYTVSDDEGATTQFTTGFNLAPVNDAPALTGIPAVLTMTEDTALTVTMAQLLAGWSDVEGGILSINGVTANHGNVTAVEGGYLLTPDADYNGTMTLSYVVSDGQVGLSNAAMTFNVAPAYDAPERTSPAVALGATDEDTVKTVTMEQLLLGWTSPDGRTLTASNLTVTHGSVSYDTGTGNYLITPEANYYGPVVLSYSIGDGVTTTPVSLSYDLSRVIDTVTSAETAFLGTYLENLTLTGEDDIHGYGNAEDNVLRGNAGANWLDGRSGQDTLYGGGDGDIYIVDNGNDVVSERTETGTDTGGFDTVRSSVSYLLTPFVEALVLTGGLDIDGWGNAQANYLTGNSGRNRLDGSGGVDIMSGGSGDDSYEVDVAADHIVEAASGGTDDVRSLVSYSLPDYVENLVLAGGGAINGTGNAQDNVLTGNTGVNVLTGGLGNDTYFVQNTGDKVVEANGEGSDTIYASVSYNLTGRYIETLTLTGTAAINATGNSLGNALNGNSGNNVLDGGAGNDTLAGGGGNDTYYVQAAGDKVIELGGEGTDIIFSTVTYNLNGRYAETIHLTGAGSINATGNSLANTLIGNSGANVLNGLGGNDTLTGGAGADTFLFQASSRADRVTDFNATDGDLINVNAYTGGVANAGWVPQSGVNVVINFGGGNVITVENASQADVLSHMVW
ncbi:cadherin-like domain-containing protein [Asticcacaulis biprosthecium]|uniref:cadherin-like domain-containing protein n=1 Tax=Asticcacaulis biprosthecium TaxID=76891 RepID=UPI0012F4FB9E|nr:cadherin-like domain-containing protein [Asticcacaulis biprosthecium]